MINRLFRKHILFKFCCIGLVSILGRCLVVSLNESIFIPVSFSSDQLPAVDITIEGKNYSMMVDLGCGTQMSLNQEIIEKINTRQYGNEAFTDFKGNLYHSHCFLIPEMKIGNKIFVEIITGEENTEFKMNTTISKQPNCPLSKHDGRIGLPLLKRHNVYLDFDHSRMAIVSDIDEIKKEAGYSIENMLSVPFEIDNAEDCIIVKIETDIGEKKFILDTGSTLTLLRSSPTLIHNSQKDAAGLNYLNSSRFVIGGHDFGAFEIPLYLVDIDPEIEEFDGFLGINFIKHFPIYIDFRKKIMYIGDYKIETEKD